ncbi:amino acid ABC transporter substrate-binding protein [Waterburya agarophytonicola K14]|uniref:Amino acid ABC transporter substrate-binding protein n=1 Tax=Waterburya agarophytonicola KI4 TaxID=2874699 RepID=A0A964BVE1_9CYAN|nr:amino acid ABC transporter substrate-binding protein [Waterburya agarophytonicola]MCC0179784.1 amino acid ABC transporter substrate-binding protein [Waterburya agarophytonicola KI4]
MKKRIVSYLSGSLLFFCLTSPVKAESILEKIQRTGIVRVAIREDAAPFGYLASEGDLQGYCLDFFALLEKQLVKNLERNTLSIKLFKSTANNRFSLVSNNIVDLECGSNTIRDNTPEGVSFSTAFFTTGTQFLVNKKNRDRFNLDRDLDEIRLGVIKNTTTEEFIIERYPSAIIQSFSGVTARTRGIQAVSQGKIDAMISDGILLRAEAQKQGLSASDYPLIPKTPLTCDRYGMIVKAEDPSWQNFVNSVVQSPEVTALSKAWFGNLLEYNSIASNVCSKN